MNKPNIMLIFRVIMGIVFGVVAVKYFMSGDYLFGGIFLVGGIAFVSQVAMKKKGN